MARESWSPTLLAAAVATAMLWLAGAPLQPPAPAGQAALLEPTGRVPGFPRRFAWTAVPRADSYEITVTPARGEPLFRQRGTGTVLELAIEEDAEPPPGVYEWEVVAYGPSGEVARARAGFVVAGSTR